MHPKLLYLYTTMYLSILPHHNWKTSETSYNAAFGKLWEEECCSWATPGFESEAVNSHFSMFCRDLNKHISKDAKSTPQGCPEHTLNCKVPLQRPRSGRHLDFGPALQGSPGQQWEDSALAQEHSRERSWPGCWFMGAEEGTSKRTVGKLSSFGRKWKTVLCLFKKINKFKKQTKSTQSFTFWPTSCPCDLVSYPLRSSDLSL